MLSPTALALSLGMSLVGQWQFYKMKYQGRELPPRDPNLVLLYGFDKTQGSHLFWTYLNVPDVRCERKGSYRVVDGLLLDRIHWVDPNNHFSCGQDPDMRLGHVTTAPIEIDEESGDLYLEIPFNGEVLYYIWKRVDPEDLRRRGVPNPF